MDNQDAFATALADGAWLRRLARGLVGGDDDAAADLVQETVVSLWQRPPREVGPLRAWAAKILRHRAIDRHRGTSRRTRREQAEAELACHTSPSADELLERVMLQRRLADAIQALAEPFRRTVVLRHFEGLSSAEIARREGVPAGTVRGRLKEALDRLRAEMDRQHGSRRVWTGLLAPLVAVQEGAVVHRSARGEAGQRARLGAGGSAVVALLALSLAFVAAHSLALLGGVSLPAVSLARQGEGTDNVAAERAAERHLSPLGVKAEAIHRADVSLVAAFSPCQMDLARARASYDELEQRLEQGGTIRRLYEFGEPNPTAEAAVRARVEALLASAEILPAEIELRCRGRVCLTDVSDRARAGAASVRRDPSAILARPDADEELARLLSSWTTLTTRATDMGAVPLIRPVARAPETFYVLWSFDGEAPAEKLSAKAVERVAARPLPLDEKTCRSELRRLSPSIDRAPRLLGRGMSLLGEFESLPVNIPLTQAVERAVAQAAARSWAGRAFAVLCHGRVCRVLADRSEGEEASGWLDRLVESPEVALQRPVTRALHAPDTALIRFGHEATHNERNWLISAIERGLGKRSPLELCPTDAAPTRIDVFVSVELSGASEQGRSRIRVRPVGESLSSARARCIAERLEAKLLREVPPASDIDGISLVLGG